MGRERAALPGRTLTTLIPNDGARVEAVEEGEEEESGSVVQDGSVDGGDDSSEVEPTYAGLKSVMP